MKNEVLIFSLALNNYDIKWKRCIDTQIKYAKRNKYKYVLVNQPSHCRLNKESAWLKIPLLIEALKTKYKWIVYLDCDIMISKTCPKIETVYENGKTLYLVKGHSGRVNSGVIIIKKDNKIHNIFNKILKNIHTPIPAEDQAPWENGHVIYFTKNYSDMKILEYKWNNNSRPKEEDYLRHFSDGVMRESYKNNLKDYFYKIIFVLKSYKDKNKNIINDDLIKNIKECSRAYSKKMFD